MANNRIRPVLSSSRMFSQESSRDLANREIDATYYNFMTASFDNNTHLVDSKAFGITAPLIFQIGQIKEDVDDLHTQVSASQHSPLPNSKLQATSGSFDIIDAPGAIVGYNVQGLNVTHASYNLTTTMAVPDAGMYVEFKAPLSGIVEIEVQIYADGGSSGIADLTFGLSDNATYNAVQTYYEQGVLGFPRFDHMEVVHKWVVPSLTPGTTYKYWLGAKSTNTTGTPKLGWGGSTSGRFSDFIMKATALPSTTVIET